MNLAEAVRQLGRPRLRSSYQTKRDSRRGCPRTNNDVVREEAWS